MSDLVAKPPAVLTAGATLPLDVPTGGGRTPDPLRRNFPGQADQVAEVRHFLRTALAPRGAAQEAVLLASELATNAIQHTATGEDGTFEVRITRLDGSVRVAVTDAGSPVTSAVTHARSFDASGRGLALVEALADSWGYQGDQKGRTVWFELSSRC